MTPAAILLLGLAAILALLDWVAVARESSVLEYVSKPSATVAFLLTAIALDVSHDAPWAWRVAALALCILGDVFLMLPKDAFIQGLASFAVAQILFTISFVTDGTTLGRFAIGTVIVVPISAMLARRFVTALRRSGHGELVAPVVCYLLVISAMAIGSVASGSPVAIAGAMIFIVSDSLIAESRFVNAKSWHPVGIMVTYHLALSGLVLGLLR